MFETFISFTPSNLLPSVELLPKYLEYPKTPIHLANMGTRYNKDKKEPKITEKNLNTVELNQKDNNFIQNLEYEVNIYEKNYYKIISL